MENGTLPHVQEAFLLHQPALPSPLRRRVNGKELRGSCHSAKRAIPTGENPALRQRPHPCRLRSDPPSSQATGLYSVCKVLWLSCHCAELLDSEVCTIKDWFCLTAKFLWLRWGTVQNGPVEQAYMHTVDSVHLQVSLCQGVRREGREKG